MILNTMINNVDIRFGFNEEIIFFKFPEMEVDIIIKDINKNIIYSYSNLYIKISEYPVVRVWIKVENIHSYNEILMEIYKDNELVYDELFFMNPEKTYIDKKDINIIINNDNIIDKFINYYKTFGNVFIKNDLKNKYTLTLNNYVLDIAQILNKMFFDRTMNMSISKNENTELKFVDENLWNN